jgi:hypothetical protein
LIFARRVRVIVRWHGEQTFSAHDAAVRRGTAYAGNRLHNYTNTAYSSQARGDHRRRYGIFGALVRAIV